MSDSTARLLLVDDHQSFLEGLQTILQRNFPSAQIDTCSSGNDAIVFLKENPTIDIVVTDISMPGMSGIELTKIIKRDFQSVKVLVLSMHNETSIVQSIMDAEAEGYVLKTSSSKEIGQALKDILNNSTHYGREVLQVMVRHLKDGSKRKEVSELLSAREVEVLMLILQEFNSEEIAEKLFISKRTVDAHRAKIMEKTNSKNLVALIKFSIRHQLLPS